MHFKFGDKFCVTLWKIYRSLRSKAQEEENSFQRLLRFINQTGFGGKFLIGGNYASTNSMNRTIIVKHSACSLLLLA